MAYIFFKVFLLMLAWMQFNQILGSNGGFKGVPEAVLVTFLITFAVDISKVEIELSLGRGPYFGGSRCVHIGLLWVTFG